MVMMAGHNTIHGGAEHFFSFLSSLQIFDFRGVIPLPFFSLPCMDYWDTIRWILASRMRRCVWIGGYREID